MYEPYLDGSCKDIKDELHKDPNLFLDFLYQIIESINILKTNGYSQNDPNPMNIMYKKIDNKYQWFIIDYGNMCNVSFPTSYLDLDIGDRTQYCMDLLMFLRICIDPELNNFHRKHKINENYKFTMKTYIQNIEKDDVYSDIIKRIPIADISKKYYNDLIVLVTRILYPKIHMKCKGVPCKIYNQYKSEQMHSDLLMYCVKHHNDCNYDKILNKIKRIK